MSKKVLVPVNLPSFTSDPVTPTLRVGDLYYNSSTGKVRSYNGTTWADVDTTGGSGATGPAGGSLTGTYPNPTLASGSVTDTTVAVGAGIAESKLALASDAAPATPSRRTLGTGANQAMPGNAAALGMVLGYTRAPNGTVVSVLGPTWHSTGMSITFTVPSSGIVQVDWSLYFYGSAAGYLNSPFDVALTTTNADSSTPTFVTDSAGTPMAARTYTDPTISVPRLLNRTWYVDGLTAGSVQTWYTMFRAPNGVAAGSVTFYSSTAFGQSYWIMRAMN